jgi:quinol monooxygenase YgiN
LIANRKTDRSVEDNHMNTRYALINKMTVKPGKRDEVINIMLEAGKPFDDNPACVLYLVYRDASDPQVIWVEDVWTNKDDHAAAMSNPAMRSFIAQTMPLLEGMPEQIEVELAGGKGL